MQQYSKAECVMEVSSRRVLYEERGNVCLPMASTTKIITCITVLELCKDLKETFEIPREAVGIEGSSVYLKEGEIVSVENLLYGLMLRSGNDCAVALALHFASSIDEFAVMMNQTAQKAGALCSYFCNPHGLPQNGHYTTAHDLALITCYAMHNTTFCQIVNTKNYEEKHWKNKNKMLTMCEGGIGVKTGYTRQAGRCLVSACERNGMRIVSVVLNSPNMYERSIQLFDDAFSHYQLVPLLKENEKCAIAHSNTYGIARRTYSYPLLEEEKSFISIQTKGIKSKKDEEIIGQFQIYLSKQLLFSGNLYKL